MNPDKRIIIDELTARINGSPFLIVIDYTKVTVPEFTGLRANLSDLGAQCHVAKNNFMRKALVEAGLPDISEHLNGQTAFITGSTDIVGAAKTINAFNKTSKKAEYKIALLDGAILSADDIKAIGDLPSREALLSKLLGTINAAGSALARVIQAYVDKENGTEETPAA
ncbi:MAG: 50S ribosomal protein L10 [Akkermansia sp.]